MKYLIKPRQTGKTYECIKESEETGAVIVVANLSTVRSLKKRIKELGSLAPDPVSVFDIINGRCNIDPNTPLIIDDADLVLRSILGRDIQTITMVSRDSIGYIDIK